MPDVLNTNTSACAAVISGPSLARRPAQASTGGTCRPGVRL